MQPACSSLDEGGGKRSEALRCARSAHAVREEQSAHSTLANSRGEEAENERPRGGMRRSMGAVVKSEESMEVVSSVKTEGADEDSMKVDPSLPRCCTCRICARMIGCGWMLIREQGVSAACDCAVRKTRNAKSATSPRGSRGTGFSSAMEMAAVERITLFA